jgi:hypothetical protein
MKTSSKVISIVALVLIGLWAALYIYVYIARQKASLPVEVEALMENADEFTLFSLDAHDFNDPNDPKTIQGHAILGQLDIKSFDTRTNLIAALNEGIRADYQPHILWGVSAVPGCFNPRHAIRAKKGNKTVQLLICFECEQIKITSNYGTNWYFLTSHDPATVFNGILKDAGVPLPTD